MRTSYGHACQPNRISFLSQSIKLEEPSICYQRGHMKTAESPRIRGRSATAKPLVQIESIALPPNDVSLDPADNTMLSMNYRL